MSSILPYGYLVKRLKQGYLQGKFKRGEAPLYKIFPLSLKRRGGLRSKIQDSLNSSRGEVDKCQLLTLS